MELASEVNARENCTLRFSWEFNTYKSAKCIQCQGIVLAKLGYFNKHTCITRYILDLRRMKSRIFINCTISVTVYTKKVTILSHTSRRWWNKTNVVHTQLRMINSYLNYPLRTATTRFTKVTAKTVISLLCCRHGITGSQALQSLLSCLQRFAYTSKQLTRTATHWYARRPQAPSQ